MELRIGPAGLCSAREVEKSSFARFSRSLDFRVLQHKEKRTWQRRGLRSENDSKATSAGSLGRDRRQSSGDMAEELARLRYVNALMREYKTIDGGRAAARAFFGANAPARFRRQRQLFRGVFNVTLCSGVIRSPTPGPARQRVGERIEIKIDYRRREQCQSLADE